MLKQDELKEVVDIAIELSTTKDEKQAAAENPAHGYQDS